MSNEHNNAPAVPQGEPVAWMVYGNYTRQPFGMLCSAEAYMRGLLKSDPDGGYHIRPLRYATPAPAQEVGLTDEEIEAIAKKHMSTVGDHWCNEEAIREIHAEDFARAIIAALLAKWGQVMDDAQAPAPAQEIDKSVADAEIKAMYVESQGSDKGWLGIEGSYFIGGVVAARKQKAALLAKWGQVMAGKITRMNKRIERLEGIAMGAGFLLQKLRAEYGDDFGAGMTEQVNDCIRDTQQIANNVLQRERQALRARQEPTE